jgi:hypothetical protein
VTLGAFFHRYALSLIVLFFSRFDRFEVLFIRAKLLFIAATPALAAKSAASPDER